jgi:ankyrin repeat protein
MLFFLGFLYHTGTAAPKAKVTKGSKTPSQPKSPARRKADSPDKNDALTQAVFFNKKDKIASLLKQGANINGVDSLARTPFSTALIAHSNGVEMLDTLRFLRDNGASLNPDGMAEFINDWAICSAFEADNARIIQLLVSAYGTKFSENYKSNGQTPIMLASIHAAPQAAKVLLDTGVNPNRKDKTFGLTALMVTGQYGPVLKIKSGLSVFESVGQRLPENYGAQIKEAEEREKAFIRLMAARGANLNAQDKAGNTALIHAAEDGRTHLVQELIKQGAKPNVQNQNGATALTTVMKQGQLHIQETMQSVEESLRADGVIKTPKTKSSETAKLLHQADGSDVAVVKVLLEGGADPNIKDKSGKSALTYAMLKKRSALIQLLKKHTTTNP